MPHFLKPPLASTRDPHKFEKTHMEKLILAGPILRRLTPQQVVIWSVSTRPLHGQIAFYKEKNTAPFFQQTLDEPIQTCLQIGERAFVTLLNIVPPQPLPVGVLLEYDLLLETEKGSHNLASLLPSLLYAGETRPSFVIKTQLDHVLHGSCRKVHHEGKDALPHLDDVLESDWANPAARPALLIMTGDQIYADDVAGPMLWAIHQAIEQLGLYPESFEGAVVKDYAGLLKSDLCYYKREDILPHDYASRGVGEVFFGGTRKPIFTSVESHNHLITLSEVLAMYCLVWSPVLWETIALQPSPVRAEHQELYGQELQSIEAFIAGLSQVQRLMAHLPIYMIFDDHDVTDDWNLTRGWEETAYGHPLARRIIGNALIGYWLCQGWGNAPESFNAEFMAGVFQYFQAAPAPPHRTAQQDALIDQLLRFNHWHYTLPTSPKMIVLDTRTQRWRSEESLSQPSGLMDWEALSELQQELMGEKAVVLVSPAPVFGVKFIEAVQRIFTFFGHALMVDAENWMAHPGSASVILNIFKHPQTPQNFVILSGDVHYSLVYDVKIRFHKNSPNIWQITCSGFKNEFPHGLLHWLERLNRWIYHVRSPLNWLTKRRSMAIRARLPEGLAPQELVCASGVGWVELDAQGAPKKIRLLSAEGREYQFLSKREELLAE